MRARSRATCWLGVVLLCAFWLQFDADGASSATTAALRSGCTIVGTPKADVLIGTARADVICGLGGNDRIVGRGGNDKLKGGPGDDVLAGGPGKDKLTGNGGDDVLRGGGGKDALKGSGGDDMLAGGGGNDVLVAGRGNDVLRGGGGKDSLRAVDGAAYVDKLSCGRDRDRADADPQDLVAADCEVPSTPDPDPDPEPDPDPAVAVDDVVSVAEDASATEVHVLDNDSAGDSGPLVVASVTDPGHGTAVVTDGVVKYEPDPGYCDEVVPDSFDYALTAGPSATVSVTVTCANAAPVADDETFAGASAAVGNTTLVVNDPTDPAPTVDSPHKAVAGDLLDGDTDDGGTLSVRAETVVTSLGGMAVLDADGDFVYTPPVGCAAGPDTFDYTVLDGDPTGELSDTGQVTIELTGCVWYVSNDAVGGDGASATPFSTLAQAATASGTGDTIHVAAGDGSSTGYDAGIVLSDGQRLVGAAVDLEVGGAILEVGDPTERPSLTATDTDVVSLASGNLVTGLRIDPSGAGSGIAGGPGDVGGVLTDVRVIDDGPAATHAGIELVGAVGSFTFSDLVVDNAAVGETNDAVYLESAATADAFDVTIQGSTFSSSAGDLLQVVYLGNGVGDLVLTDNTFSNDHPGIVTGGGGVSIFQTGGDSGMTMTITGNTFRDAVGTGVLIVKGAGSSRQQGTFSNNDIGDAGTANSGSLQGSGLRLQSIGGGSMDWAVNNNIIRGYNNHGIEVVAGGGATAQSGELRTVITNNTITDPGTADSGGLPKQGVHYNIGTVPGDSFAACAVLTGNSLATSGSDGDGSTTTDTDVRIRQRQLTTVRLPGYGGSPTDEVAVAAFLAAANPTGSPTVVAAISGTGGGFVNEPCPAIPVS